MPGSRLPVELIRFVSGIWQRVSETNPLPVELTNPATGQAFLVDEVTGAQVTIPVVHHEVHEGEMFKVAYKSPDASPIADDGTIILVLQATTLFPHIVVDAAMGANAELELREETTFTGGTAMVERNMNRSVGDGGNTATVVRDPTVVAPGNLLDHAFMPGGRGGNAVGSTGGNRIEWIGDQNTNYMIRLTNRGGNAQPGSLAVTWYEETVGS